MRTIHDITERVRAEYLEMPGMRLTAEQVQRLCGVEQKTCQIALDELVNAKFLCVKPDGHYARLTDGQFMRPRPAKADFSADTRSKKAS
jgi:endonuclease III